MPRTLLTKRVDSLERQKQQLLAQLKKARADMAKRQREDDKRRQHLLGAAALAHLDKTHLTTLIRAVIPAFVKSHADLALFADWLPKLTSALAIDNSQDEQ